MQEQSSVSPVNVIYQTAEDGLGDTIKPRLLAAGADCSKVLVIDDSDQPLTMADVRLEEAIVQTKEKMVVLKRSPKWWIGMAAVGGLLVGAGSGFGVGVIASQSSNNQQFSQPVQTGQRPA